MNKTLLSLLACSALTVGLLAQTPFEANLKATIQKTSGIDINIKTVDELEKEDGLKFVVATAPDGRMFPLYATNDGKSIIGFSSVFFFEDEGTMATIKQRLDDLAKDNQKAQTAQIGTVFKSIPESSFIYFNADTETDALTTIVTDPDCPYCRNELKNLKEHLKTSNVRMVFAPVQGKTAQVKSALILKEAKGIKPSETDKLLAVFNKYYANVALTKEQLATDVSQIEKDSQIIFGSGAVRGVPFVHQETVSGSKK